MQDPSRPATGYPAPPFNHPNGGQRPPPPTTAYYAAPPPYAQPQYYNPNPPRSYASRACFRAFLATMICIAVVFGVILIITWLILRPTLPDFRVDTVSVNNFSANVQSVNGTWQLGFLVRNGNKKMTINYNSLQSSIFYHSAYLSEAPLAPFKQDTKSETTLNATLSAANAYVERSVVDDLNRQRATGSVPFDVHIFASTSFRSGSWRFRTRVLKVLCRTILLRISSNTTSGKLVGGNRECQVWT